MNRSVFGFLVAISFFMMALGCSQETPTTLKAEHILPSQTATPGIITFEDLTCKKMAPIDTSMADIAITEFTGPSFVTPGDTLALHASVTNIGIENAVGPFDVWIGVLGTGFEFRRITLSGLEAGGVRSGLVNFNIAAAKFAKAYPPGNYTLYCTHDFVDTNSPNDFQLLDVELISGPDDGFVLIPAGTFTMGSPGDEPGRDWNETQHQVTLTKDYYISPFEVTEQFWDEVMGDGTSTSQKPKTDVTGFDAVEFCNELSLRKGLTPAYEGSGTVWTWNQRANGYRLPTEAEWEYACRAGSMTAFANGAISETGCGLDPNLDAMGWYCYNSEGRTHDVGQKQANNWGLYDMHGNVWEWCWDSWDGSDYSSEPVFNPVSPSPGPSRVLRGGSWDFNAKYCRSAYRMRSYPGHGYYYNGLRLARTAN